jgi:hypothetical protein
MVDSGTLMIDSDTSMIDDRPLTIGDDTLMSDDQHRLSSTIASMTRWRYYATARTDSAVPSPAQLDRIVTMPNNTLVFASTR